LFVAYELCCVDERRVDLVTPTEATKCMVMIDVKKAIRFPLRGLNAPLHSESRWHWNLSLDDVRSFLPKVPPGCGIKKTLSLPSRMPLFPLQIVKLDHRLAEIRGMEGDLVVYMPLTINDGQWAIHSDDCVARASRHDVCLIVEWYYTDHGTIKIRN
jgi:hypothetical protein